MRTCAFPSCVNPIRNSNKFCSSQCSAKHRQKLLLDSYLDGTWDGSQKTSKFLSSTVKRFILERDNYSCVKCGFDTVHPDDGKPVVEVNHIDGNSSNHKQENLETLCPNCHSLTPNYRARNTGFGSEYRRLKARKYNNPDYVATKVEKTIYYCACGEAKEKRAVNCKKCAVTLRKEQNLFQGTTPDVLFKRLEMESYTQIAAEYGAADNTLRAHLIAAGFVLPKKNGNKSCPECGEKVVNVPAPYYCPAHKPVKKVEWPSVDEVVNVINQSGVVVFMEEYNIKYVSTVRKFLTRHGRLENVNLSKKFFG